MFRSFTLAALVFTILAWSSPPIAQSVAVEPAAKKDPTPPVTPIVTLPEKKTAKPNRYFCLKAGGNCTTVKWIVPSGLERLDPEIPIKDTATAVVLIGDSGVYVVQAYGALGDQASDIASCEITIGTPPPPVPPGPPPPPPPPPALTAALQAAYAQDQDTDKATSLSFLQKSYAAMAVTANTWTTVKTVADATSYMKNVVEAPGGLTATQIVHLRGAVATELVSKFGSDQNAAVNLASLATELGTIATALATVK